MVQIPIELHTANDPMCQKPIMTVYVGYIPRVGDVLWCVDDDGEGDHFKVIQVAQWAEPRARMSGAGNQYLGRICAMVQEE